MNEARLEKNSLIASLPAEWSHNLLSEIQQRVGASRRKLVVLDDDPTGTQTVYGIPVLTEWSVEQLVQELSNAQAGFYLLTNTRSLPERDAVRLNCEIGQNLLKAAKIVQCEIAVVSRGDSTLRGHFPTEVEALAEALENRFDGFLLVPFFLEGERFTANDIHYVTEGAELVPVGQTEFAADKTFGFFSSNLREWVEEKSFGRLKADKVASITLEDLRLGGPVRITELLLGMNNQCVCIVNAMSLSDIQVFVYGLLEAEAQGKKFLYRTSASFVQVRAGLKPRKLLETTEVGIQGPGGGLVIVGSYVPKTTSQLNVLFSSTNISKIEIYVDRLIDETTRSSEIARVAELANVALSDNQDVVVFTSRILITGVGSRSSLAIGNEISEGLVNILRMIKVRPRYLVAKGGITSSDLATKGLNVKRAMVLGQVLPGVPVWKLGEESRYPGMSYVVFPGNVGSEQALAQVVKSWKKQADSIIAI